MDPCLPDLFTDQYPAMPGLIMMASMFGLFVVEMYLNGKLGGHSHGGPLGFETHTAHSAAPGSTLAHGESHPSPPPRNTSVADVEMEDVEYEKQMAQVMYEEKMGQYQPDHPPTDDSDVSVQSEMPPWFVVFYEQYIRQRLEMISMIKAAQQQQHHHQQQSDVPTKRQTMTGSPSTMGSPHVDEETGQAVDPAVYRKMSLNITLLEGGILFHSVFVGMTVSITIEGFIVLLIAILFHQMFEGLGLGSRIADVPYPRGSVRPWLLVVAFGMTAPVGQAIGLIVRDTYDPNSAFGLIIVGVFNAM